MDKTKGRINMSDLIVRPRMLKSGKMVYEYAFEIARIDGKRKRKTKSGFRTKREAKEAGKIELRKMWTDNKRYKYICSRFF